jgi:hypothetical protein
VGPTSSIQCVLSAVGLVAVMLTAPSASAQSKYSCRPVTAQDADQLRGRPAVVTDIDGVLTEYVDFAYGPTNQIFLDLGGGYPRIDAALMMNIYHRRGYVIIYMAGRPRDLMIKGKNGCEASLAWLTSYGFPTEKGDTLLLLQKGPAKIMEAENRGQAMAEWMGDHGTALFTEFVNSVKSAYGLVPRYGYVDSDGDVQAYLNVGVPPAQIFSIGNKGISRLGYKGTTPIVGRRPNPGYTHHVRSFVIPKVPSARK